VLVISTTRHHLNLWLCTQDVAGESCQRSAFRSENMTMTVSVASDQPEPGVSRSLKIMASNQWPGNLTRGF
jgi:hypothetical protein